jgi:hypothetical protein
MSLEYVKALGGFAADPIAAASNNSMQPDVNALRVSKCSQRPELFGLAQNGLFDPRSACRYLYTENIPCYKWTCSLSGTAPMHCCRAAAKALLKNAFPRIKNTMRQDSPSVSARAANDERQVDKT